MNQIFKDSATKLSPDMQEVTFKDILRTLFFSRIAILELVQASRSKGISDELRNAMQKPLEILRGYDQKVRSMYSTENPEKAKWLTQELSKEKIYDIGNLVECAAMVHGEIYEDLMGCQVLLLQQIISSKNKGVSLDVKKYQAIFKLLAEEIKAESNGQTSIIYDKSSDSVTFKLQSPKSQV